MNDRRGYTLIEMLVALFLFAIIVSSSTSLVVNGLKGFSLSDERAQMNQLLPSLQAAWQSALRATDPADWRMEDGTLRAPPILIVPVHKALRIEGTDRVRAIPLPGIVDVALSTERHSGLADCAVLDLRWESRHLSGTSTNRVRFVACGRGSP